MTAPPEEFRAEWNSINGPIVVLLTRDSGESDGAFAERCANEVRETLLQNPML